MQESRKQRRILHYMAARWPVYVFGFALPIVIGTFAIWFSWQQGWYAFVAIAFALLLILCYFLGASIWSAEKITNYEAVGELVCSMSHLQSHQIIADINPGLLRFAEWMSTQLLSGKVIAIDISNPQITPGRSLTRSRQYQAKPLPDPRLSVRQGSPDLLPLPDNHVSLAMMFLTLSELWQEGDKQKILKEIRRIVEPGGCLFVAEQMRNKTNLLTQGPFALRLRTAAGWRHQLEGAGFRFHSAAQEDATITLLVMINE